MMNLDECISVVDEAELGDLLELNPDIGQGHLEQCYQKQQDGQGVLLKITLHAELAGFVFYNRLPKYWYFESLGAPEIQDLFVLESFRKKGLGTALIKYCENLARQEGAAMIGVSVALYSDYGPAQILYMKRGYVPDGQGITYDRAPVMAGEIRPVDAFLCLMMLKKLL
jgi:GNAT superfamily N-acetyltransferase